MAKKATTKTATPAKPETETDPGSQLTIEKITATAAIEFKHPYEHGTLFQPTITLEYSLPLSERPLDDEGKPVSDSLIMDELLADVTAALNRSKCKTMDRLKAEEKLHQTRLRLDVLKKQSDRPLSGESKKAYTDEMQLLIEREKELVLELEAVTESQ